MELFNAVSAFMQSYEPCRSNGSMLYHRSLPPVFESRLGHI